MNVMIASGRYIKALYPFSFGYLRQQSGEEETEQVKRPRVSLLPAILILPFFFLAFVTKEPYLILPALVALALKRRQKPQKTKTEIHPLKNTGVVIDGESRAGLFSSTKEDIPRVLNSEVPEVQKPVKNTFLLLEGRDIDILEDKHFLQSISGNLWLFVSKCDLDSIPDFVAERAGVVVFDDHVARWSSEWVCWFGVVARCIGSIPRISDIFHSIPSPAVLSVAVPAGDKEKVTCLDYGDIRLCVANSDRTGSKSLQVETDAESFELGFRDYV